MLVLEGAETIGGGCRSAELTLPGFVHDVCSAVHPLAAASPFFAELPLAEHGLRWIHPDAPLAHPLDDGTAVVLERSVATTAATLGAEGGNWRRLVEPFVEQWNEFFRSVLAPIVRPPRHPLVLSRFGRLATLPATALARHRLAGDRSRALFAGLAAHAGRPLDRPFTAAFGLVLGVGAHAVGWPIAHSGSQRIVDALSVELARHGGGVRTNHVVSSMANVPAARVVLFDVAPSALERIAGARFPERYRAVLRSFRHGAGVFKVDMALDGPIPWTAPECARAVTVHLGGTMEEIAQAMAVVARGGHADRPFVLLVQPTLFDPGRAPEGRHVAWAYCHVPNGSTVDMTGRIAAQIERFAPGFRDRVLASHVMGPADLERHNPNCVGGDIACGAHEGLHLFTGPALRPGPYTTPSERLFLCSAATPPGPGVHGMPGYHAAGAALRRLRVPG